MNKRRLLTIWNTRFLLMAIFCSVAASPAFAASLAGTYTGAYSGSDSGTVTITVDTYGAVGCDFYSTRNNVHYRAGGSALSHAEGTVNGLAFTNTTLSCVTTTDFAYPIPLHLAAAASFEAGPSGATSTFEGNWFASNGGSGAFTAAYSAAADPTALIDPVSLSGSWFDPAYAGSGFDIIGSTAGLLVTYYGWDKSGHLLWLTSEVGPAQITPGQSVTLDLLQTSGGTFADPESTRARWGTLTLNFTDCTTATATLNGADGELNESLTLLAGLNSFGCR